jgi:hypothetical protein
MYGLQRFRKWVRNRVRSRVVRGVAQGVAQGVAAEFIWAPICRSNRAGQLRTVSVNTHVNHPTNRAVRQRIQRRSNPSKVVVA